MTAVNRRSVLKAGAGAAAAATLPGSLAAQRRCPGELGRRRHRRRRVRRLDRAEAPGCGQEGPAGRRLGAGPCPRLLGRGIADDARRLWRATKSIRGWRWTRWPSGGTCRTRAPGLPLFHQTGVLFFFPRGRSPSSRRRCASHRRLGLPTELLDAAAMRRRFPQIRLHRHRRRPVRAAVRRADGAPRGADAGRRVRRARAAPIARRGSPPPDGRRTGA